MKENQKKAKKNILEQVRKLAEDQMREKMDGMKKVTVASPTKEGLKEGLDKAEEMMSDKEKFLHSLRKKAKDEDRLTDEDIEKYKKRKNDY